MKNKNNYLQNQKSILLYGKSEKTDSIPEIRVLN